MTEKNKGESPPQVDKFRDLARELECDDDEVRFDEKLKKLAKAPRGPVEKSAKD